MRDYSEEELKEKYEKLPPNLRAALSDPDISNQISKVGEKLQIPSEELEELRKICGLVFLGLLPLENLEKEVKERLALNEESNKSLVDDLKLKVFSLYKEDLVRLSQPEKKKTEKPEVSELKELLREFKERGGEEPRPLERGESQEKPLVEENLQEPEIKEKIEIKEELLKKKGPDKYLEPIEVTEKDKARIIKEGGRIKKVF